MTKRFEVQALLIWSGQGWNSGNECYGSPGRGRGGGKGAKPAALAVAQGMNMDTLGGGACT